MMDLGGSVATADLALPFRSGHYLLANWSEFFRLQIGFIISERQLCSTMFDPELLFGQIERIEYQSTFIGIYANETLSPELWEVVPIRPEEEGPLVGTARSPDDPIFLPRPEHSIGKPFTVFLGC